jgi:hypothetical protein
LNAALQSHRSTATVAALVSPFTPATVEAAPVSPLSRERLSLGQSPPVPVSPF